MRKIVLIMLSVLGCVVCSNAQKKTAQYYFDKGETALVAKEYVTALAHYNECLRVDPYFSDAYRSRGIAREHLGQKQQALTDFNVYIDLKPNDAEALFNRAVLRFESEQYPPARQDFLKLLTMPAGETNTIYYSQEKYNDSNMKISTAQTGGKDYIYNYLGMIETKIKRYDKAIAWMDSALAIAPTNASYWINRGTARQLMNDKDGAAADFQQALTFDPENGLALHNLASLKSSGGEADVSEKLLDIAIEKNKNIPYPRAERAYQRLQKNDLQGALEDYNEVIKMEPNDDEYYVNRGLVKEKMNDFLGALVDFTKAISLDDNNAKAWVCRGNLMTKQKKLKEAVEDYSVAIHANAKYGPAYYNRAIAYVMAGKLKESCADVTAAEQLGVKTDPRMKEKVCK